MFDSFAPWQVELAELPPDRQIFLEGPAGCGKTTAAVERMLYMMACGVPGGSILVLLPQRTLGEPYQNALVHPGAAAGGLVTLLTVGGLAQRMVDLFWPLAAESAGFSNPERLPVFLTLETAQYYMAHLVRPKLEEGLFETIVMDRNRLYSQVIDNLNKAAVVGFPYSEIGPRLKSAWMGEPVQLRVYDDVQACASLFRSYCLERNLLDFSLQMELFVHHLWPHPLVRNYLEKTYRHIIFDNLEEDTPVAHDLITEWLPALDSALLVYDQDAGYRSYLGADPVHAYQIKSLCTDTRVFSQSFVSSPAIQALSTHLSLEFQPQAERPLMVNVPGVLATGSPEPESLKSLSARYYPQMLEQVVDEVARLIQADAVPAHEIAILAPFLSDALRFSIINRLQAAGLPVRSHRPSRSLREEPTALCLLTLAMLAYPEWCLPPTRFDVAYALMQAIEGLDLVRAQLIAEICYRIKDSQPVLSSFDLIRGEMQERITYSLGERYEQLRDWIAYSRETPATFDHFLSRLFGELLSQPGFGMHTDFNAGRVAANLIESVQKFRWVVGESLEEDEIPLGKEYLHMVQDGVIAAQYTRTWQTEPQDAVFVAPAYTFLMANRPVRVMFWLDVGSLGWSERLYQPLTQPYVLSRNWVSGQLWTDQDEVTAGQTALQRLVVGLLRRCRERLYFGVSQLGEQGYEQRGPLLHAYQRILRSHTQTGGAE